MEIKFYPVAIGVLDERRTRFVPRGGHGGRTVDTDCGASTCPARDHLRSRRRESRRQRAGSATSPRARRFGCCARWKPPASSARRSSGVHTGPGARIIQLGAQALSQRVIDRPRQAGDGEARRRDGRVGLPQRRGARRDRAVHQHRRGHALGPARQLGRSNRSPRHVGGGTRAPRRGSRRRGTSSSSVASRPTSPRSRARCTPRLESSPR